MGCAGGVTLGERVLMGPHVAFHSQNHKYADTSRPIKGQGVTQQGIIVGNDCWLGSGAIILDGVRLGHGCVVAAGAVVTKSFPAHSLIGGIPGRELRAAGVRGEESSDGDDGSVVGGGFPPSSS
jgi:acetyltransferase-like isoleucine patch superfamily enzyme